MENLLKDVRIDLSLLKEEWEFERLDFDDGDARAKYVGFPSGAPSPPCSTPKTGSLILFSRHTDFGI